MAGKSPPRGLNLDDWLHSSPPADTYVLVRVCSAKGFLNFKQNLTSRYARVLEIVSLLFLVVSFQEIVPLNAENVLGTEVSIPCQEDIE